MIYRLATEKDLATLAHMRWNFRTELAASPEPAAKKEAFLQACIHFLQDRLNSNRWAYWLVEQDGEIVAHAYVQVIEKVPRPSRFQDQFGYVTNVYTRPEWRGNRLTVCYA